VARYSFKAIDQYGKSVSGVLAAPTVSAAHLMVVARGLQPVSVEEKTSVLQYEVTKKKVPREEVMHFSRQLGVFVKAGIPILDSLEIIEGESVAGGGSTPDQTLPTWLLAISGDVVRIEKQLRAKNIIARIENNRVVLDLRTVFPEEEALIVECLDSD